MLLFLLQEYRCCYCIPSETCQFPTTGVPLQYTPYNTLPVLSISWQITPHKCTHNALLIYQPL